MPQCPLVWEPRRRPADHRGLEAKLQHGAATQRAGWAYAHPAYGILSASDESRIMPGHPAGVRSRTLTRAIRFANDFARNRAYLTSQHIRDAAQTRRQRYQSDT